jgi:hypothetical protein
VNIAGFILFYFFLKKKEKTSQPWNSSGKSKLCIIAQSKNINARALQWQLQKRLVWVSNIPK